MISYKKSRCLGRPFEPNIIKIYINRFGVIACCDIDYCLNIRIRAQNGNFIQSIANGLKRVFRSAAIARVVNPSYSIDIDLKRINPH